MVYVEEEEEKEKEDSAVWSVAGGRLWLYPRPPTESPVRGPATAAHQGPLSPPQLSAAITPIYLLWTETNFHPGLEQQITFILIPSNW